MIDELKKKYGADFCWYMLEKHDKQKKVIEDRLDKEIVLEHDLYHIKDSLVAFAKNERNDDVLFWVSNTYYVVHLTWSDGNKQYPRYTKVEPSEVQRYLELDYLQG